MATGLFLLRTPLPSTSTSPWKPPCVSILPGAPHRALPSSPATRIAPTRQCPQRRQHRTVSGTRMPPRWGVAHARAQLMSRAPGARRKTQQKARAGCAAATLRSSSYQGGVHRRGLRRNRLQRRMSKATPSPPDDPARCRKSTQPRIHVPDRHGPLLPCCAG